MQYIVVISIINMIAPMLEYNIYMQGERLKSPYILHITPSSIDVSIVNANNRAIIMRKYDFAMKSKVNEIHLIVTVLMN